MKIQGEDYIFTPNNDYGNFFDVELLQIVNKGKQNERKEFKLVAYGISLANAVEKVIMYRINSKYNNDTISLKTFLKEYKELNKQLKDLCYETEKEDY